MMVLEVEIRLVFVILYEVVDMTNIYQRKRNEINTTVYFTKY